MAVKKAQLYKALTAASITTKLKDLGTYHISVRPTIDQLIDIDRVLCQLKNTLLEQGASKSTKSREGYDRYMVHPLIPEIIKMEATKQKTLNDLLLTPSSIEKAGIQIIKTNDDVYEDAIKNRTEINEAVKNNKKRK